MATLTIQTVIPTSTSGLTLTYTAAATATTGDEFNNNGVTYLSMRNTGTAAAAVAIQAESLCSFGFSHDLTVTLATGVTRTVGKLPVARFGSTVTLTTTSTGPGYAVFR